MHGSGTGNALIGGEIPALERALLPPIFSVRPRPSTI